MAVSAVPIACSYWALAPKTKPASQAATKARQMAKNAGELEKYEARCARRSNGPRRSASPRSIGCLSDISPHRERHQGLLGQTPDQPSVDRPSTPELRLRTSGEDMLAGSVSIYRPLLTGQSLPPPQSCLASRAVWRARGQGVRTEIIAELEQAGNPKMRSPRSTNYRAHCLTRAISAIGDGGIFLRCGFPASRTAGRHSCTQVQSRSWGSLS